LGGNGCGRLIEVPSRHLPGGIEDTAKNL